jgi:hypothetical protein
VRSGPLIWVALLVATAIIIFGIVSVFRVPAVSWRASDRLRWHWTLIMILFGPLAVLLFYGTVRQQLLRPEDYVMVDGVAPVDR